ncbi:MAG: carboxypeptidase-like regulatory domain-containing protein [Pyrinomonadaceae bacterium]|nr:carboxypeptidase-like regulatory domain-containing protein [Pyrinomonadaceae bacterium]
MKRTIILILILTSVAQAQQRNLPFDAALPAPGSSGTVTLPLTEYNRLSELALRKLKAPDAPPLPFVLSRAAFRLRIEDQRLVGTVDIEGAVLEKGPTKVPLTSGLTILEARQAGSPLPIMQEGSTHSAIINGPGRFSVTLNVASSLTIDAGRASFFVPVPSASSSLLTLELAGNHADVRVEPGLITSRTAVNGRTTIEATLEPGKPARVWWTTREIAAPVAQREVRFLSDIKTVVSVGDSQMRITALCDLAVIQGEAIEFRMPLPPGYELTEVTGSTLDSYDDQAGVLILRVRESSPRNHQFLVALERTNRDTKVEAPLFAFEGAQREIGEVLVEGVGAMELTPSESGGLRRMDVREASAIARSLARFPLQAAFRYNRRPGDTPKLQLEWTQFPDSPVLSAVAERATITTLTNVEGKSLTEVTLRVRNHSQPFVRVQLPSGATLLSAEVEGQRVKPMLGTDGSRVPLLRTGFNPRGAYTVSFVYLNSGTRFGKSGAYEMGLPKLDIPVNLLTWEISLPDRIEVRQFGGNALAAELFPAAAQNFLTFDMDGTEKDSDSVAQTSAEFGGLGAGQIGGVVVDPNGAVVPNAAVNVINIQTGARLTTSSDGEGRWVVSGVQPGAVSVSIESPGFKAARHELQVSGYQPARLATTLEVGAATQTVTVTAANELSTMRPGITNRMIVELPSRGESLQTQTPSQNVLNLQRRVAGILPVRVDIPRAGKSYRFVRPLVMEEETKVTFQYKSK